MSKSILKVVLWILVIAFFTGCAVQKPMLAPFTPLNLNPKMKSGEYVQKVDNFLVILDSSGSMSELYKGKVKLDIGRNFLHGMNQTLPDLKLTAGLRTFGGTTNPFSDQTKLAYGMTGYSNGGFEGGLLAVAEPKGETPMSLAFKAATEDLKSAQGKIAVIVVSDGRGTDGEPLSAAKAMKTQYGDRICIYTVLVGDDPVGKSNMEGIASAGQCGFPVSADQLVSGDQVAEFVEKVFLAKVTKPAPPPAPAPAAPPAKIGDSDQDGVPDDLDRCPGTPLGAKVDQYGCWNIGMVLFDVNKTNIKPKYTPILDEVTAVMKKNPGLKMEILGHTDSTASAKYNQGLSERRAKSVMAYFVKKGIKKEQLMTKGFGLTRPIADNKTVAGKAQNRRVELNPTR